MEKINIELDLEKKSQIIKVDNKSYRVNIQEITKEKCACGCGKKRKGLSMYAENACRTRAWRRRKAGK